MELRPLGRSGVKVSAIGLGVMTFGAQTGEEDAFRQLDMALDAGVTLFDTAENYPVPLLPETQGRSEDILGRWIAARRVRARVTIATKVTGPDDRPGNLQHIRGPSRRLDRANIRAALDASLKRLGTDYIDLYQVHWAERIISTTGRARFSHIPDAPERIPIEETLAALSELKDEGKILHVGVCNESPWGVMRYLRATETRAMPRIVSVQNSYSLLDRQFEIALAEVAIREGTGLLAYSPLAGGMLTGKYAQGAAAIEGSRSSLFQRFDTRFTPNKLAAMAAYLAIAEKHGLNPAHMALAFVRQQPFVTSVLMAASTSAQLADNLKSLDVTLAKDVIAEINAVHDQNPNPA